MPVREYVEVGEAGETDAADAAGIIECIGEQFSYLRERGAALPGPQTWGVDTLQAFRRAGYKVHLYANSGQGGRIDAVMVYGVEQHIHVPSAVPEPWLAIKVLAVRAQTLPEATHETQSMRVLAVALPQAVAALGTIGLTAQYTKAWTKLHDFLATFPQATFEDEGGGERVWMRFLPGLTGLRARAAVLPPEQGGSV